MWSATQAIGAGAHVSALVLVPVSEAAKKPCMTFRGLGTFSMLWGPIGANAETVGPVQYRVLLSMTACKDFMKAVVCCHIGNVRGWGKWFLPSIGGRAKVGRVRPQLLSRSATLYTLATLASTQ